MKCQGTLEEMNGKAKILLAEDSASHSSVMKAFLESNDHEVIVVGDGAALFNAVDSNQPDVILLDRLLPGIDSTEVCRRLKQDQNTSGIPIIMLTDTGSPIDRIAGLTAGADDCIPKPCHDEELSALICARLRTKTQWDDLKQMTRQLQTMLARVETLANVDSLTGLFNRRRFEAVFATEFKKAARYRLPLSCLMLDIDHFKDVNDNHGHAAGDSVLREVVGIIQNSIRDVDTVARWGGEEFIIVSPNTSKANARVVGERIRKAVSGSVFQSAGDRTVTISIGIADVSDASIDTPERLIETADLALYEAKKGGRDRVVLAPSAP
jgi:diguanylate cyclase (GGDEF)-like protein